MLAADVPPAAISVQSEQYAVIVWGEANALTDLKKNVDAQGAVTQWRTAGSAKSFLLFIAATGPSASPDMQRLKDAINHKKYGDLDAAWGKLGKTK